MTAKQKIFRSIYPLLRRFAAMSPEMGRVLENRTATAPVSFYSLQSTLNGGSLFDFFQLRGKKVLVVNTASGCGFTGQFEALQELSDKEGGKLWVLAFPANDFKGQEAGSDEAIALFCKESYQITFPLMKKTSTLQTKEQHPVYQWLTQPAKNGWNSLSPNWNFCKYLVDENGRLTHIFGTAVSPLGKEVADALALPAV